MQNRQNGRRRRGSGGNNPRPMGMASGGQGGANRLEVRVRGNASQLLEKYKVLARDAHQAGDRVATEYYLQHADHYFRVLNDSRIRQEEMRSRRSPFDQLEDEGDDDIQNDGDEGQDRPGQYDERSQRAPDRNQDRGQERSQNGADRGQDREQRNDRGQDRPRREPVRDNNRAEQRPERVEARVDTRAEADERPRRYEQERAPRRLPDEDDTAAAGLNGGEHRLSDGEAALVAFGGPLQREPQVETGVADDAPPPPRRRGRPRKTEVAPTES